MKKDFILPDIGEGIVECEIVEWLVQEGEQIKEDQPVCDVMTDKALVQIPAVHDGMVTKLYYQKGDIAKVHQPLFEMDIHGVASDTATATATEVTTDVVSPAGHVAEDFILPDIGEGIVECEIVEWLVQEGEQIKEDQPVCDVMTDKALVQIPAKHSGTITKLYYQKGDIAKVHQPLFEMSIAGNAAPAAAVTDVKKAPLQSAIKTETNKHCGTTAKAVASPAVRRLARELDIDLTSVTGSGDKGRVYKTDVVAFAEGKNTTRQPCSLASEQRASTVADKTEAIKGIKAAMARQMTESVSTIPHFTYCEEIDLTTLIALRGRLKDQYAEQGIRLTMMPFFIKALSMAIKQFPVINSRVNDDCTLLTYLSEHNIGVAVDSKVGLLVPNIKGCQSKSVLDIAAELTRITEQARDGRVSPADLKGGTVTISNIGALGGTVATPIINKPEAAIVALGKVQSLPRFDSQGQVVARQLMQVSWSGDHRIIDGGTMARFCNLWKQYLEDPATMLVSLS